MVMNLPADAGDVETWVQSLGGEDPPEKEMATHSCLENPMDRGACRATVHRVTKSQTRMSIAQHNPYPSVMVFGGGGHCKIPSL